MRLLDDGHYPLAAKLLEVSCCEVAPPQNAPRLGKTIFPYPPPKISVAPPNYLATCAWLAGCALCDCSFRLAVLLLLKSGYIVAFSLALPLFIIRAVFDFLKYFLRSNTSVTYRT